MTLYSETKNFLIFVLLGLIFSLIFDIFRAIRKIKKPNRFSLYFQDIMFFLIIGVLLLVVLIYYINCNIRLYNILAIILGVLIYISIFGNSVRNIICKTFKYSREIIIFLMLPFEIYKTVFLKHLNNFKKIVINCCKKNIYVINSKYAKMKNNLFNKNLNKRGFN